RVEADSRSVSAWVTAVSGVGGVRPGRWMREPVMVTSSTSWATAVPDMARASAVTAALRASAMLLVDWIALVTALDRVCNLQQEVFLIKPLTSGEFSWMMVNRPLFRDSGHMFLFFVLIIDCHLLLSIFISGLPSPLRLPPGQREKYGC